MWFSEVHRIGFRKCTPAGYVMLGIGDLLFLASVVGPGGALLASSGGWLDLTGWHLLMFPAFVLAGIIAKATANTLASARNFEYKYEADEAVWGDKHSERFTRAEWERDYLPRLRKRAGRRK